MSPIPYHVLWPGGNTTVVVNTPVDRRLHRFVAKAIMDRDRVVEQAGFIEKAKLPNAAFRLQMMGGEFCGNAARAAGWWWARRTGESQVHFEVSGFDELVTVNVQNNQPELVLPGTFISKIHVCPQGTIVDLKGIRHIVAPDSVETSANVFFDLFKENHAAVGVMRIQKNGSLIKLNPRVWVRDTQTIFDETACGSGSIAVALAAQTCDSSVTSLQIAQPSGAIFTVELEVKNKSVTKIILKGDVTLIKQETIIPVFSEMFV